MIISIKISMLKDQATALNNVSLWKKDLGKWRMNENCSHSAVIKNVLTVMPEADEIQNLQH